MFTIFDVCLFGEEKFDFEVISNCSYLFPGCVKGKVTVMSSQPSHVCYEASHLLIIDRS